MRSIKHTGVLVTLSLLLMGCCRVCVIENFPPPPKRSDVDRHDTYRIDLTYITDATLVRVDTSPQWDLGRFAAGEGKNRIILMERTTSYPDLDEDLEPIAGTVGDRKTERLWLTIPADHAWEKPLKISQIDESLIGYEVNMHDNKGYFAGPCVVQGIIGSVEEQSGMLTIRFDLEVHPQRPFAGDDWMISGTHTIRKYINDLLK